MMQPHELVRALVHEQARHGKSLTTLAREMHSRSFQGTLHKFISGQVREPSRLTATRIARHFKLPLEALYDERAATAEAQRLGLATVPPARPSEPALVAREPSATYIARLPIPAALSPRLCERLKALSQAQLDALERVIHAHLDAMDAGPFRAP